MAKRARARKKRAAQPPAARRWITRPRYAAILVFVVAFALYANTLGHDFVWDDHDLIARNPIVKTLDGPTVGKIFLQDFWGAVRSGGGYYRPVVSLSYHVDFALYHGGAGGFHFTNVLLNALACLLVFVFIDLLFGNAVVGLTCALLFAVHPVHTEAVAWISGRTDVMATLWMLASLCLYVLWRRYRRWWHMIAALVAFMLAMLSKEMALCLPFLVILLEGAPFEVLFNGAPPEGAQLGPPRARPPAGRRVFVAASFVGTLALYLLLRIEAVGGIGSVYPAFAPGALGKIALPLSIFGGYVYKVLVPLRLNGEYDAPIPAGFGDPAVILGAAAAAAIAWGVWRCRRRPEVVLGAGIFVFGLGPVMNVVPIAEVSAERFLYFPSLGVTLVLGWLFARALQAKFASLRAGGAVPAASSVTSPVVVLLALLLPGLAARTLARNADWKNDEVLFSKTVAQEPDNPRAHAAVADAAMRRGDIDAAIRGYRKSIELNPDYTIALSSLAGIYARQGRFVDALPLIERALRLSPEDPKLINNLGSLYFETQQYGEAAAQFEKALEIHPDELNAHFNLGLIRLQQGDAAAARPHFERAVRGGEDYHAANYYLAVIDNAAGKNAEAKRWARAFLAGYTQDDDFRRRAEAIAAGAE